MPCRPRPGSHLQQMTSSDEKLVLWDIAGHTQVHFDRDSYLLGRPTTVTSCTGYLQLDLIISKRFFSWTLKEKKSWNLAFLHLFQVNRQLHTNEIQTSIRFFSDLKSGFLKSDTFFLFCTNHSSGLLCSCKRFCVVDFWPLFSFFGITKKLSFRRRKSTVRKKGISFMTFWTLLWHHPSRSSAFTVIAPNTQLFIWEKPISSIFT